MKKQKIPFVVHTAFGKVDVLGTAFNVDAYSMNEFAITLVRGLVDVVSNEQQVALVPGEQAHIKDNRLVKWNVGTDSYTSWKDGKLIFNREPFSEMILRLERWYNVKIEYSSGEFNDLWYSGTIENETITEVMEMIAKAACVSYSFDSKSRIIKISMKAKRKKM